MTYTFIHAVKFMVFTVVLLISFCMLPSATSHAYFATGQEASTLGASSMLFTIDYKFGHGSHEIYLPVATHHSKEGTPNAVSYTILDTHGNEVPGKAIGMVFSSAKLVEGGMYMTTKTEAQKFTLAVIFTPNTVVLGEKYRLQVSYLPFNFDGVQQLQLNPAELTHYTTEYTSFK